jgi:hypothetical protein
MYSFVATHTHTKKKPPFYSIHIEDLHISAIQLCSLALNSTIWQVEKSKGQKSSYRQHGQCNTTNIQL